MLGVGVRGWCGERNYSAGNARSPVGRVPRGESETAVLGGVNKNKISCVYQERWGGEEGKKYEVKFDLMFLLSGITVHDLDPKCSRSLAANPREDPLISGALSVQ